MVFGWNIDDLAKHENDEGSDRATKTELVVDERIIYPIPNSILNQVVTTGESKESLANEKKIGTKLHAEVVKAELRVKYLET